jgi:hypothetical protein
MGDDPSRMYDFEHPSIINLNDDDDMLDIYVSQRDRNNQGPLSQEDRHFQWQIPFSHPFSHPFPVSHPFLVSHLYSVSCLLQFNHPFPSSHLFLLNHKIWQV